MEIKKDYRRIPLWITSPETEYYAKALEGADKRDSAVVLGAIPYLRDIAARGSRQVTVVEQNSLQLLKATAALEWADPKKEIWLHTDFFSFPFSEHSFDTVLGDLLWSRFREKDQRRLRDRIARMLSANGIFVSRFYFRDSSREQDPFVLLQYYLERMERDPALKDKLLHIAFLRITDLLSDQNTPIMDRRVTAEFIRGVSHRFTNTVAAQLAAKIEHWMSGFNYTIQTRTQILKQLEEKFIIQEESPMIEGVFCVLSLKVRN
ncbi:MAG TPA: class I SAM-dependent methyltransferase [Candidatus Paceibacterota bacterium]